MGIFERRHGCRETPSRGSPGLSYHHFTSELVLLRVPLRSFHALFRLCTCSSSFGTIKFSFLPPSHPAIPGFPGLGVFTTLTCTNVILPQRRRSIPCLLPPLQWIKPSLDRHKPLAYKRCTACNVGGTCFFIYPSSSSSSASASSKLPRPPPRQEYAVESTEPLAWRLRRCFLPPPKRVAVQRAVAATPLSVAPSVPFCQAAATGWCVMRPRATRKIGRVDAGKAMTTRTATVTVMSAKLRV